MSQGDLDDMADKCIAAHEAVMEHGTIDMQVFSRGLLYAIAKLLSDNIMGTANGNAVE